MDPIACVVPARLASSRFPSKPLALIQGKPMILHVLERAHAAACFQDVVCATDSQVIAELVESQGFRAIRTSENCATGSDRVRDVAALLDFGSVVNLQGDEPLADSAALRSVCHSLRLFPEKWVTVSSPLQQGDWEDRHTVKLLADDSGNVLQFARQPSGSSAGWRVHRGVYAYSRRLLEEFCSAPRTPAEIEQSLEQLRVFPARAFQVVHSLQPSRSVDVPSDILVVESLLTHNKG